jgi:hypothetical protein
MQIRKLIIGFLIVFGLVIFGLIFLRLSAHRYKDSHCLITQLSSRFFDLNNVRIHVSDNLKTTDFKIKNRNSGKFVFENGQSRKGITNEYGICSFNVYYKDSLLFEIGHEKLSDWHTNDYSFDFKLTSDTINPTLIITGLDNDKGNLYYKRFDRNESGLIYRIVYLNKDKMKYNEELIKNNWPQ